MSSLRDSARLALKGIASLGLAGLPAVGIERMLRIYLLQCWFSMSDKGLEGNICDSYSMRSFLGIDFHKERAPDSTGALQVPLFFLWRCGIAERIFEDVKRRLERAGLKRLRRDNR